MDQSEIFGIYVLFGIPSHDVAMYMYVHVYVCFNWSHSQT